MPIGLDRNEAERGEDVSGGLVIKYGDAEEILEPSEAALGDGQKAMNIKFLSNG